MTHLKHRKSRRGFTLVELVVVILIMGIIAAVAGPKMFNNATKARESATRQSLAVVRDAIELFKSDESNVGYPATLTLKNDLKKYLRGSFPKADVGPKAGQDTVEEILGEPIVPNGNTAWAYNPNTGEFIVNDNVGIFGTW